RAKPSPRWVVSIFSSTAQHGPYRNDRGIDVHEYQAVMDANVRAPVLFAKAVIPHLAEGGRIITIGSARGSASRSQAVTIVREPRLHHEPAGPDQNPILFGGINLQAVLPA